MMKINIEKLGPIQKGEIPLNKKLLFFVGQNNSGKSYATQLIWAIYNEKFRNQFLATVNLNKISRVKKVEKFIFKEEILFSLIKEFEKYIQKNIHNILSADKKLFKNFKIKFIFSDETIIEILNKGASYTIVKANDSTKTITIEKKLNKKKLTIKGSIDEIDFNILKIKILEFFLLNIFEDAQSFFLPSIRGAYINLFQYINRFEKEKKEYIDKYFNNDEDFTDIKAIQKLINESKSSYTMATNQLINKITALNNDDSAIDKYKVFLNEIVEIIGGDIILKKNPEGIGTSKFYLKTKNNLILPMHISSSTTNQLAPLYLFFKYWGRKTMNDMLIIDEPEENLHPENQLKFLNIMFNFIASQNNKVVLTSHSPLMTKYINSLISYNELSDENKKLLDLDDDFKSFPKITKNDIEVCYFDGKRIYPYVSNEYGVMFKDFINVDERVSSNYNAISNKLYKQNEE